MNVVVIEDEPPSAAALVELLAEVAPAARVVARLASVDAAVRWLSAHPPPDLVFADIELGDGRVFEAFRRVPPVAPIVFTTAYDRFLLDAFQTQGIAYLLKPFGAPELAAALAKHDQLRRGFAAGGAAELDRLVRQLAAGGDHRRHFTVKAGRRIQILPLDRVALIALGLAGIEIIDLLGKPHTPSSDGSLVEIERSLPPAGFFRINRTEIVALAAIDQLSPDGDRIAIAVHGRARPCVVSGHRAAAFRRWVGMT